MVKPLLLCTALACLAMVNSACAQVSLRRRPRKPNRSKTSSTGPLRWSISVAAPLSPNSAKATASGGMARPTCLLTTIISTSCANPAFPQREGGNPHGEKDANGKMFHDEFLKVVKAKGAGWVDYMFPKPGQKHPS